MRGHTPAWLLLLAVLAAGCERTTEDLLLYIDEVKRRPAVPATPLPELRQFPPVTRDIERDPFQPLEK